MNRMNFGFPVEAGLRYVAIAALTSDRITNATNVEKMKRKAKPSVVLGETQIVKPNPKTMDAISNVPYFTANSSTNAYHIERMPGPKLSAHR